MHPALSIISKQARSLWFRLKPALLQTQRGLGVALSDGSQRAYEFTHTQCSPNRSAGFSRNRTPELHSLGVARALILALASALATPANAEPSIQSIRVISTQAPENPTLSASAPIPHPASPIAQPASPIPPVQVTRTLPASQHLARTLAPHLAQPATDAELGLLADLIVDHLKAHHWPVTLVTVWDEDDTLAQGRVTLQVQQGTLGDIAIIGGSPRRQRHVAEQLQDLANTPLNGLHLQRRLDALAFSPWLAVASSATPGATLDTANLILTLRDESPLHAFASYENNGVEPLGENRYSLGLQWLNAFALGQDLTFLATTADDPDTLAMLAATWRIPLPWHHELRLSGYYAETHSTADILTIPLDVNGTTWEASARYVIPWRLSDHWRSEGQLGFDYKQFNTAFTFGDIATLPGTAGVGTAVIGTQWFYDTQHDHARLALEAAHGEPGWAQGQDQHTFEDLNPQAKPRFSTLRADATYQHDFRHDLQTALRLGGQWTDGPVLASEELALASTTTVRGYPERSIRASRGAWASVELRSPPWQPFKSKLKLRALTFTDAGYSADKTLDNDFIASAGLGLRAEITSHLSLRADLAFPLIEADDDLRVHLAAVVKF